MLKVFTMNEGEKPMKHTKITKLVITSLTGLAMGGALIAPQVLPQQNVNASQVRRRHHARKNGLRKIHGRKYYFVRGRKLKGFRTIRVHGRKYRVYFSKKSGAMLTGFRRIHGRTYYFSKKTGNMLRGRHRIGKRVYIFINNGKLVRSYTVNMTKNKVVINNNKPAKKATVNKNKPAKKQTSNNTPAKKPATNNNAAQKQTNNNNDAPQIKLDTSKFIAPSDDFIGTTEANIDFLKIKSQTAKGIDLYDLPDTFHGMPLPGFADNDDILKNGYIYNENQYTKNDDGSYTVNNNNDGRIIFPVSEDNGIITFSNGVRTNEAYATDSSVNQDTIKHDVKGIVYTEDDIF